MRHGKIAEPVEKRYIFGLSIRILSSKELVKPAILDQEGITGSGANRSQPTLSVHYSTSE
jgi:hypothetical protein